MIEMLGLYVWTILAGVLAAPALALLGTHLATRDRAMQTLCVGQGAMVGVLCGIGFLHRFEGTIVFTFGPFGSALLFSSLTYVATDVLVAHRTASRNTMFAFVFALLLATGYLVGSLFPALESHMAQIYFGDLATLTEINSQVTIVMSLICIGFLVVFAKQISNQSFEHAIFGRSEPSRSARAFQLVSLAMLCLSVQFVGFLFTVAMLFLPTALLTFVSRRGLIRHFFACVFVSAFGTAVGFTLSLYYTRLPTVPAIVMVMFLASLGVVFLERLMVRPGARFKEKIRPLSLAQSDVTQ